MKRMESSGLSRRQLLKRVGAASIAIPLGGSVASGLAGCSSGTTEDALAHVKQVGTARLAIADEPPYTKINPDGSVTGAAPDIARSVLKRLGVSNVEGIVTPYEAMIPGLQARRWDLITAGLFMKRSRCAEILYSEPDIVSTESFAVPRGNPKGITTVAHLKRERVKVGVLPGSFEEGILKTAGVAASQMVSVQDGRSGVEALESGRIDAFFLPTLSLKDFKETGGSFDVTPPVKDAPKTGAGAGFRKTDRGFRDAYNAKMDVLKRSGEFDRILAKWGFSGRVARSVTTAELCRTPG